MHKQYWLLLGGGIAAGLVIWLSWSFRPAVVPVYTKRTTNTAVANVNRTPQMMTFSTADLPDRDPALEFSLSIPTDWRVEYLSGPKAINVYDAADDSLTTLDASRLIIRAQSASLPAVPTGYTAVSHSTLRQQPTAISLYQLTGPGTTATSAGLPAFVANDVTMAYVTTTGGATAYTIMKSPLVSDDLFSTIITSLTFH